MDAIPEIDEPTARTELLERLERLEALVQPLAPQSPGIGHNNPPSPIGEEVVSREEWEEVVNAIRNLRAETSSPEPDISRANREVSKFKAVAAKIGEWLLERATTGIDATIKAAGMAVGAAVGPNAVSNADEILSALNGAIDAGVTWISTLPLPF